MAIAYRNDRRPLWLPVRCSVGAAGESGEVLPCAS